jgi:AbrB family looped-hinge helix DNA binding protein
MQTTIDKAGRLVIPKALRVQVGMASGTVEVFVDGAGIRIESVASGGVVDKDGILMLAEGFDMSPEELREFRLADQR